MSYGVHSRDYLRRARLRLDEGTHEALFYAAFELRCGVEARMQQYLETQLEVDKKLRIGWRIADLSKQIEKRFKLGDKVAEILVMSEDGANDFATFYYTPVTSRLRNMAERLGGHCHAAKYYGPDDPWWNRFRSFLEDVYSQLIITNSGNLLGPPLRDRRTGRVHLFAEPAEGEDPRVLVKSLGEKGENRLVRVRYLDKLPDNREVPKVEINRETNQITTVVEQPTRTPAESHRPASTASKPPKVGRNDPCPCGSGKKYKKCHMIGR